MSRAALSALISLAALTALASRDWTVAGTEEEFKNLDSSLHQLIEQNLDDIQSVLERFDSIRLNTNSPVNDIVHGLLGHSEDYVLTDHADQTRAFDWILREASWKPLNANGPALVRYPAGWQFRRARSAAEGDCCEAHFGQFLYYLVEGGASPAEPCLVPPSGDEVRLASLIEAMALEVNDEVDLSYALPGLLQWGPRSSWQNRYGESIDYSSLLDSLLNAKFRSDFCGACLGDGLSRLPSPESMDANLMQEYGAKRGAR